MDAVVCSRCNCVVPVNGSVPPRCPDCGSTLGNARDQTRSLPLGFPLPDTIIQNVDEHPVAIGRYIVERELGSGGFGTVYLAMDEKLARHVAIKIPKRSRVDPYHKERFAREARNAAQLRHPGIVSVYNVEEEGDLVFIVSEYVAGLPLDKHLKQNEISFRTAASLVASIAWAVEYAHSQKIIHRDIKPSNIMIDAEGNPRLMDFGLAKREEGDETITAPNQVIGTPAFMSPEQAWGKQGKTKNAEGEHKVDRRSDVYSLGAVLYQLLTRELPFRGEPQVVRRKVIEDDPKPPREINEQIPVDLERICRKAMAKEPSDRYRTAGDLAADLERWLRGEPILARHIGSIERSWRWCRRNPITAVLIASIALLLTTIACGATAMYAGEHKARTQVEQLLSENRELLAKAYVERANRHLGPESVVEEYSPIKALPWLYAAMEMDERDPARRDASRLRLGAALRAAPTVVRIWSHHGPVSIGAVSPVGDRAFSGGLDGTARIWELAQNESAKPALIHPEPVTDGTFSPDGKLLLTGCADGAARLWDAATDKLVLGPIWDAEFSKHPAAQPRVSQDHRVRFSSNGRLFVTVRSHVAEIWDIKTGQPVAPPIIAPSRIGLAEFMQGDSLLLIACFDGPISACDVQTGKQRHVLEGSSQTNALAVPAIAPDGTTIAGAGSPNSIVFWDAKSGKKQKPPPLSHESVVSVARFSRDGRLLATGTSDGTVSLWRTADGQLVWKRRIVPAQVLALGFSPRQSELAVRHVTPQVYVLDTGSGNLAAEPVILPGNIKLAQWAGQNGELVTANADGSVRLWRMESQEAVLRFSHSSTIACDAVAGDKRLIATVNRDGTCCLLNSPDSQPPGPSDATTFSSNVNQPIAAALAGDGTKLAIASKSAVSILDLSKGRSLVARLEQSVPIRKMAFTSDGRFLIAVSERGRVSAWDASTGERSAQQELGINGRLLDVDIAPKLHLCAVALGQHVVICNAVAGTRAGLVLTHAAPVVACRLSPDGRFVLSGSQDGIARVWDIVSGKVLVATSKLSRVIEAVEFSPDAAQFVAGCRDGTARLWSTADGRPASETLVHGPAVTGCLFSPDSHWLVTLGDYQSAAQDETVVRAWDASTGEPVFVRPISRLSRRFATTSDTPEGHPWHVMSAYFSPDGRRLQVVAAAGVFAAFDMVPEARAATDLLREVAVRSGAQPDSNGGLLLLEPDRLVSLWRSVGEER